MTKDKAIAELIRIWHSPHLDLSLKAGLGEAIEALKENNQSDSLVTDSSDDCKESESKLDLISRQDALAGFQEDKNNLGLWTYNTTARAYINSLPSAKPKTGKWAEIENGEYLCGNCLHITIGYPPSNCPNCGSFNGGEEE